MRAVVAAPDPLAPIADQMKILLDNAEVYWQGDDGDKTTSEIIAPPGSVKIAARTDW